jgi:hypothetical protein
VNVGEQRDVPRSVPTTTGTVTTDDGVLFVHGTPPRPVMTRRPGPVTLADREGVFAHSFKCGVCDLEFVLFSWIRNRHGVGRTACPECAEPTPMLHWVTVLSRRRDFGGSDHDPEIHQLVPIGNADLLDDSRPPAASRFTDHERGPA